MGTEMVEEKVREWKGGWGGEREGNFEDRSSNNEMAIGTVKQKKKKNQIWQSITNQNPSKTRTTCEIREAAYFFVKINCESLSDFKRHATHLIKRKKKGKKNAFSKRIFHKNSINSIRRISFLREWAAEKNSAFIENWFGEK